MCMYAYRDMYTYIYIVYVNMSLALSAKAEARSGNEIYKKIMRDKKREEKSETEKEKK